MKSKLLFLVAAVMSCANAFAAEPTNAAGKIKIVLVGDSTVNDGGGWGYGFKQFLTRDAGCSNTAMNGRSTMSFMREGRWTNALALKGDYYLIQFGHNNEPGKPGRSTDMPTFVSDMKKYVDDARAIGAKPVLVTPLCRRQWDKENPGKIKSSLVPYAEEVRKITAEKNVPLVDLHDRSREYYEKVGKEECEKFSPVKTVDGTNTFDGTHLKGEGRVLMARLVVAELRKNVPGLVPYLLAEPNPAAAGAEKIFDVKKSGATGDGKTLDTAAIQKTLDECAKAGGGTVEFPPGTYLSRPIFLKSNGLTLQLDEGATLQATDNFSDFDDPQKPGAVVAFVNAAGLDNLTFTGKGVIDGAGAKWWPDVKTANKNGTGEPRRRPRLVVLQNCNHLRVEWITLQNSPSFHLVPRDCEGVTVEDVTIRAPGDSPNTDATDPSACRHVIYRRCTFDVGDDNIAIKSGHVDPAHPDAAVEDFLVEDCTFLAGHGMSIGSETIGGVKDLIVRNCTFDGTTSGIRIKSDRTRGGVVDSCTYSNLTMKNVKIPINITSYYPKIPATDSAQPVTDKTPLFRNLKIVNVTADSPQSAGFVVGLPEGCVSNLVFENVKISAPHGLTIRNAKAVKFKDSEIKVEQGTPVILEANAEASGLN